MQRRTTPTEIARGGSRPGALLPLAAATALLAACAPLTVLFTDSAWIGVAAATIAVVVLTGGLLRATAVPLVIVPFAQTAAFGAMAVWLFGELEPGTGIAGTAEALRDLVLQGVDSVRTTTAPVQSTPQLLALLAVVLFLCALLLETLAVGLGLAGLSGVVLLVMAAAPPGIRPTGSTLWVLGIAGAGWLVLLAADHAVRMRPSTGSGRPSAAAGAAGPALGAAALGTAGLALTGLLLSAFAPAGEGPWLRDWWNSTTGARATSGSALDPFVNVRAQLGSRTSSQLLTYRTSDGASNYLSVVTLEAFDGTGWAPYPPAPGLPVETPAPEVPARAEADRSIEVQVAELANAYLPVPDGVLSLDTESPAGWSWDVRTGDAVSSGASAGGVSYKAVLASVTASPEALSAATTDSLRVSPTTRALPPTLPVEVADLALQVTAGAGSGYERAIALQRWFTTEGGFRYSLNVADPGSRDPLLAFLTDKVGFCQQYATAMAVMARTLGIPARVVVGFTGGSPAAGGGYLVTGADAHAWPELWFDGVGWVRFEPTPASAATSLQPPAYSAPQEAADPDPGPSPSAESTTPETSATDLAPGRDDTAAPVLRRALGLAVGGALAVGAVLLPLALRRHLRRARLRKGRAGDADAAWQEIAATAIDAGVPWPDTGTMRQQARAAESLLGRGGRSMPDGVWRVVRHAEAARYAVSGRPPTAASTAVADEPIMVSGELGVDSDVQAVLSALDAVPRPLRRRLLPASLIARMTLRN